MHGTTEQHVPVQIGTLNEKNQMIDRDILT